MREGEREQWQQLVDLTCSALLHSLMPLVIKLRAQVTLNHGVQCQLEPLRKIARERRKVYSSAERRVIIILMEWEPINPTGLKIWPYNCNGSHHSSVSFFLISFQRFIRLARFLTISFNRQRRQFSFRLCRAKLCTILSIQFIEDNNKNQFDSRSECLSI